MSNYVLDASAILALLNNEPGYERVISVITEAAISSVNLSEVIARFADSGMSETNTFTQGLQGVQGRKKRLNRQVLGATGSRKEIKKSAYADFVCIAPHWKCEGIFYF